MLQDGYSSGAIARAVAHIYCVSTLRALVRHLSGTVRVTLVTAEFHFRELFLDEVPYEKGGAQEKEWHRTPFTLGGHLHNREVSEHLTTPTVRRRAMESMLPVIILRYVQGRRGVGASYAQELLKAEELTRESDSTRRSHTANS